MQVSPIHVLNGIPIFLYLQAMIEMLINGYNLASMSQAPSGSSQLQKLVSSRSLSLLESFLGNVRERSLEFCLAPSALCGIIEFRSNSC